MYAGKLVFAQVTDLVHLEQFRRCVRRYNGEHKVKTWVDPCVCLTGNWPLQTG
jgi:hypothetical protein